MNWYKITKVNSISYEIQLNDIISIETVSSEYMMQYIGKVKSNNIQNLRALCVLTGYTIIRNENNTNIIFVDFDHEHIFAKDEYYVYKRSQMCGEVAVITISEFIFGKYVYDNYESLRPFLRKRCAIPMLEEPLKNKSLIELGMRMDSILHKKIKPRWVREHKESSSFADYYIPMLEADRKGIDNNWEVMKRNNWIPVGAPNSRYSENMDGLETTLWMLNDFQHLMNTDDKIDYELTKFNANRRRNIVFPDGWGK